MQYSRDMLIGALSVLFLTSVVVLYFNFLSIHSAVAFNSPLKVIDVHGFLFTSLAFITDDRFYVL